MAKKLMFWEFNRDEYFRCKALRDIENLSYPALADEYGCCIPTMRFALSGRTAKYRDWFDEYNKALALNWVPKEQWLFEGPLGKFCI